MITYIVTTELNERYQRFVNNCCLLIVEHKQFGFKIYISELLLFIYYSLQITSTITKYQPEQSTLTSVDSVHYTVRSNANSKRVR